MSSIEISKAAGRLTAQCAVGVAAQQATARDAEQLCAPPAAEQSTARDAEQLCAPRPILTAYRWSTFTFQRTALSYVPEVWHQQLYVYIPPADEVLRGTNSLFSYSSVYFSF